MSKNNLKKCISCDAEIAKSAKVCPQCGQKNKKPIYMRAWFIVALIIVIGVIIGNSGEDSDVKKDNTVTQLSSKSEETVQIEYHKVDVATLVEELEANAMKAEKTYGKQYLEITGKLANIDSDGKYITLYPGKNDFEFQGVQCYIKNDEQSEKVINMSIGDTVTIKGKVKSIGEIIGYTLDIDSIE